MVIAQDRPAKTAVTPPVPTVDKVVPIKNAVKKKRKSRKGKQSVEVSQDNPNYITPTAYADAGRHTVDGKFQLDVASCAIANRIIQARKFFTPEDDGLTQVWGKSNHPKKVWCNPPGGRGKFDADGTWIPQENGHLSSQRVWFEKFVQEWRAGNVWGVFLSFNPDVITRNYYGLVLSLPHMVPKSRPKFQYWDPEQNCFVTDDSPTKGGLAILFPPRKDADAAIDRFCSPEGFGQFGHAHDPRPPKPPPLDLEAILAGADELDLQTLLTLQGYINQLADGRLEDFETARAAELEPDTLPASGISAYRKPKGNGSIQTKYVEKNGHTYGPYYVLRWWEGTVRKSRYIGKTPDGAK